MDKLSKAHDLGFKVFRHASQFHESDHRLRNTAPANQPDQVAIIAQPAMVLSAFAIELYLKCLLCLETARLHRGHNLKNLFDSLQPKTRARLTELWDADIMKPERQRVLAFIRSRPDGDKLRLDLPSVLVLGANAFEELRYFYEGERSYFLLSDFPNALRGYPRKSAGLGDDSSDLCAWAILSFCTIYAKVQAAWRCWRRCQPTLSVDRPSK